MAINGAQVLFELGNAVCDLRRPVPGLSWLFQASNLQF